MKKCTAPFKQGIRFLLEDYDLLAANYPADQKPHPLWETLSFPIFYHADRLFVLRVLKELNALDHPGAQKTLDWLLEKQTQIRHLARRQPTQRPHAAIPGQT